MNWRGSKMIDLNETILDQWVEFSGGSRPNSNKLMFESGEEPRLNIQYVFDWDTKEIVNLSFRLRKGDFEDLLDDLMSKGYSSLTLKDDSQELFFEWKMSEDRIMIRIDGQSYAGPEGKVHYLLSDFRDLILD